MFAKIKSILKKHGIYRGLLLIAYTAIKKIYFYAIPKIGRLLAGKVSQNMILFDSLTYGDNARVLSDRILATRPQYKIIWFVDNLKQHRNQQKIKFVKRVYAYGSRFKYMYSIWAYYYAYKAKYVFYTHSFNWVGEANRNQLVVNLWHGTGYKSQRNTDDEHNFDFMIVPGQIFIRSKSLFFDCAENKILPLGYPRYDVFAKNTNEAAVGFYRTNLKNYDNHTNIIWLPTFLDNDSLLVYENPLPHIFSGVPLIEKLNDFLELDAFCKQLNINIIIKRHMLRLRTYPAEKYFHMLENIAILSDAEFKNNNINLYELLPHTAALISDFSSASVDYMLLDKPIGYVVSDLEDYRKTRGFVFDNPLEHMPGEHIYTLENLKNFIADVANGIDKHKSTRTNAMARMHNKTENYSERLLNHFNI
ncbi:MAG: CDP-glycerol glycerophosphotransferase family protein [Turicibacter sp.]|nr:CDP-glycerol glycerophosphotransferase family protein [Turicibacter sp.]